MIEEIKIFEPTNEYESTLKQKSFKFSVRIANFYKITLQRDKSFEPLYKQALRSGTSIAANIYEAQSASSQNDFINKFNISLKESRETEYWLQLLKEIDIINRNEYQSLKTDLDEIIKMLVSSLKTLKGI